MRKLLFFVGLCLLTTCHTQESSSAASSGRHGDAEEIFSCMCVPKDECKDDTVEDKPKLPQEEENRCGPEQVCCSHLIVRTEKTVERHSYYYRESRSTNDPSLAQLEEVPWQAVILTSENDIVCSGVLVSSRHVLTTAHCAREFLGADVSKLNILLGTLSRASAEESGSGTTFKVQKVTLHPNFQSPSTNNIAVLETAEEVPSSGNVRRVPVAKPEDSFEGKTCFVSGWDGSASSALQKVNVTIVGTPSCEALLQKAKLGSTFEVPENSVCVAGPQACQGDEGSPLVCHREGEDLYVLWAVVSKGGLACEDTEQPGIFTSIPKSLDFVAEATGLSKEYFFKL